MSSLLHLSDGEGQELTRYICRDSYTTVLCSIKVQQPHGDAVLRAWGVQVSGKLLDIVGTGGDGAHTINISTAAIILAAACGCKAAKLGNRSVSSKCGTSSPQRCRPCTWVSR